MNASSRSYIVVLTQAKKIWDTLEHRGVTFPPPYVPHGQKLLYDGEEVDLSPEEEEVWLVHH